MVLDIMGSFVSRQRKLSYAYAKESPNQRQRPSDSSDYIRRRRVLAAIPRSRS